MSDRSQREFKSKRFIPVVVACLLLPFWSFQAFPQSVSSAEAGPPDKGTALQQAIHDYILAHPEVLIQSIQQAKMRQQEHLAMAAKSKIVAFRKDLLEDPDAPVLGNPAGDVTLVEFFDYRCQYCRQVEPWLQALVKEDHGVRLVQKEFPILGPASVYAAKVALVAWKLGKHAEFHNALMAKQGNIDEAVILQIAESVGLDLARVKVDMNSEEVVSEVQRSTEVARALGLSGTPGFIIGAELVPGATDLATFKSMVDDARRGVN
jgi:protein-disulfide isomerase